MGGRDGSDLCLLEFRWAFPAVRLQFGFLSGETCALESQVHLLHTQLGLRLHTHTQSWDKEHPRVETNMQRAQTHLHVTQILLHYGHFLVVYSSDLGIRFLFNCLHVDLTLLHLPQTTQREKVSVTESGMRKFDLSKPFTQSLSSSNETLALAIIWKNEMHGWAEGTCPVLYWFSAPVVSSCLSAQTAASS